MTHALLPLATVVVIGISAFDYLGDSASEPITGASQSTPRTTRPATMEPIGPVGGRVLGGLASAGRYGAAAGRVGEVAEQIGAVGRRIDIPRSADTQSGVRSFLFVSQQQIAELALRARIPEDKVFGYSEGWGYYVGAFTREGAGVPNDVRRGAPERYRAMLSHVERREHDAAVRALGADGSWRDAIVAATEELGRRSEPDAFEEARQALEQRTSLHDLSPKAGALLLPYAMLTNDRKAARLLDGVAAKDTFFELLQRVRVSGELDELQIERAELLNNVLQVPSRYMTRFRDTLEAVFGPSAFG